LDRFEGHNRAGSGLFFILMTFSCLDFKNYAYAVKILPSKESWNYYHLEDFCNAVCQHSHYTGIRNPGTITIRRTFRMLCANTRTAWKQGILELLPSGGNFERNVPTLALHGINGKSAGNYHAMNEESTQGRGFLQELPAY
jgi:hypothetical protein